MKRFLCMFALILTICITLLFAACQPFVSKGPKAANGVMDFRETDFHSEVYALDGEWELYYGKLYTPKDFQMGLAEGREYIDLPGPDGLWLQ